MTSLAAAGVASTVLVGACGIQDRPTDDAVSACTDSCPGGTTTDGGGPPKEGGLQVDGATEGGTRSGFCGSGCNPDPSSAKPACPSKTPDEQAPLACQVVRASDGNGATTCAAYGTAALGDFCHKASDCDAGLACVSDVDEKTTGAGRCRAYCCGGGDGCASGTYCGVLRAFEPTRPLADRLPLPVCAPASNCKLLEPDLCDAMQACMLVNDKTTTCATPGVGITDDKCPCASGYYCSPKTQTCRKVCHIGADQQDCGKATCVQGGQAFPPGFGVCAGT